MHMRVTLANTARSNLVRGGGAGVFTCETHHTRVEQLPGQADAAVPMDVCNTGSLPKVKPMNLTVELVMVSQMSNSVRIGHGKHVADIHVILARFMLTSFWQYKNQYWIGESQNGEVA